MSELVMTVRAIGSSNEIHLHASEGSAGIRPSKRTEQRWVDLVNQLVLRDHDLILLALYRLACPKATAAEINAFLFRANFGNLMFRFYNPSQISKAEKRIVLVRKVVSTTAYQAMLPIIRQKR